MEEKVLKTVHMWQITQMSAKYLPSISKKNLNSDNVSRLRPLFAPDIPYLISQAYTTSQTTAKLATLLPRQLTLQTTQYTLSLFIKPLFFPMDPTCQVFLF